MTSAVSVITVGMAAVIGWHDITDNGSSPAPVLPASSARNGAELIVGDDRSVSFINLGGPVAEPLPARIATEIGPAVAAVEGFWGTDWSREITVVVTGNAAQFAAQVGPGGGERVDTAAVAVADRVHPQTRTVRGQRIVFAPGAVSMSDDALRMVLRHELFHFAARADTALDAPRWLTEGVADYVARLDTSSLPSDADFTGTAEQLSAAYDRAWLFARFVSDRYGAAALRLLYVRVCGPWSTDVPSALRDVLGADPDTVLAQWRGWAAG